MAPDGPSGAPRPGRSERGVEPSAVEPPAPAPEGKGEPRPSPWGNRIRANRGQAVNAGRIDGGVHYYENIDGRTTHRLRQVARISADRVSEVRATFCPSDPARYATFQTELAFHGTGIITGNPGTGRALTAVHALAEARPGAPIEELAVDPAEKDAGIPLVSVDSDHSRLLDLTPLPRLTAAQQVALRDLVDEARKSEALLVLIAGPGQREGFLAELPAWLHIGAPARAADVFRRVMEQRCGHGAAERWLSHPGVQEALEGAEPARALRLAQEASRRRRRGRGAENDDAAWIEEVLKECADAAGELARWFNRHDRETEFNRVLLTAVALLEGGHRAVVVRHAHRLAREWHIPSLWRTPISGEGLTAHLWEIGAHVREDCVHLNRRKHGDDVLDYLWREHPGTRALIQEWGCEAVPDLDGPHRDAAARRWLRLARRQRDVTPVRALIDRWGDSGALMWSAVPAIAEAAVTPELGAQVRSALYQAARAPGARLRDRTVLEVCRVYGRVQPETALTRIGHLAEKVPSFWDEAVTRALEDIAGEPGNTAAVVKEMLSWAARPEKGRRSFVAVRTLCRILGGQGDDSRPRVMSEVDGGGMPSEHVVDTWCVVSRTGREAERPLWSWLGAVEAGPGRGGGAFEVLCRAARRDRRFSQVLERCIGRWKHAHELETPVLDELLVLSHEREEKP